MFFDIVKKGSTDRSVTVTVVDSTTGAPETGVAYNTAGIDLWYMREGATKTSITEATLAGADAAHSDGGFIHIADGVCRLDLPDAAFATGANYVDIGGAVTGMVVIGGRVRLVDFDLEVATVTTDTDSRNASKADVSGLATSTVAGEIKAKTDLIPASPAAVGSAMTLTSGERTALAAALEAAIINELDGAAVMQAIADLIASDMSVGDLSVVAIATAVRDAVLDRVLDSNHDTAGTPGALLQAIATRATQASVDQVDGKVEAVDAKAADLQAQVGTAGAGLTAIRGAGSETLATLAEDIAAIDAGSAPTAEEVAAEVDSVMSVAHGSGDWTGAVGGTGDVHVTGETLDTDGVPLRYVVDPDAEVPVGIGGAVVRAYVASEYDAGYRVVRGSATTVDTGYFNRDLMLNDGVTYVIEYHDEDNELSTVRVEVSA